MLIKNIMWRLNRMDRGDCYIWSLIIVVSSYIVLLIFKQGHELVLANIIEYTYIIILLFISVVGILYDRSLTADFDGSKLL